MVASTQQICLQIQTQNVSVKITKHKSTCNVVYLIWMQIDKASLSQFQTLTQCLNMFGSQFVKRGIHMFIFANSVYQTHLDGQYFHFFNLCEVCRSCILFLNPPFHDAFQIVEQSIVAFDWF